MNWIIGVVLMIASILGVTGNVATIGGTQVPPDLTCEEDEVIAFVWKDTLRCVHIDIIRAE